jgi:hypothetical protein
MNSADMGFGGQLRVARLNLLRFIHNIAFGQILLSAHFLYVERTPPGLSEPKASASRERGAGLLAALP